MNKIAIISDIHGNLPALEAVLEDIQKKRITKIICLGDLVGYYCYFNEVVSRIKELNIPSLMGNHDYALVKNNGVIESSKTCTKILTWQLENATKQTMDHLNNLPKELLLTDFSEKKIFAVHAGLKDPIDEYVFDVTENYFKENNFEYDVLLSGHTHLLAYKKFYSGKTWINPGSVGQPRDFDNRASYVILDEKINTEFVRVRYDFEKVVRQMKDFGFESYISDTLITGKKIGL